MRVLPPASVSLVVLLSALGASSALAAWPNQPGVNVPICRAANFQFGPQIIPDGSGGAIITWEDLRTGSIGDVYAQHVLASGVVDPAWPVDGRAICTAANEQAGPLLVSDGAGGAIIAWSDARGGGGTHDIYAQRILASGIVDPAWPVNGRALCTAANDQEITGLTSDGAGGAIATWQDARGGVTDIYARRVTLGGVALWTADGVAICTATNAQENPTITSDGSGGAIIAWDDFRNGSDYDVFALHVQSGGTVDPAWPVNGTQIVSLGLNQLHASITTDGAGGALIAYDAVGGSGWYDVYMNHVYASGIVDPFIGTVGRAICVAAQQQDDIGIVSDGAGGAMLGWQDGRNFQSDIFASHVTGDIVDPAFPVDGLSICTASGDQQAPCITTDGAGGALLVWRDLRTTPGWSLYAQHVLSTGATDFVWPFNGRAISIGAGAKNTPAVTTDGAGGAIAVWEDYRNDAGSSDLYAQRIEAFGRLGNPEPVIVSAKDVPNDQGGHLKLSWNASYLDAPPYSEIRQYEVWRSIPSTVAAAAIRSGAHVVRAGDGVALVPGRSLRAVPDGTEIVYWEYVGAQPSHRLAGYSFDAPTAGDSVGAGNPLTQFMVIADDNDYVSFWMSAAASGYAVDNLPPAAPVPFTGAYLAGATHLHWGKNAELDLAGYRLYRGSSSGFVPGPANLVSAQPDTGYADPGAAGSWYKLSAVDSHGNESPFAVLGPSGTLDVAVLPSVIEFGRPHPNPALGEATLHFALPREAEVTLAVFDAVGRRVRVLERGRAEAGGHDLVWDLRDEAGHAVGAGRYFVSLDVEGRRLVRSLATLK